MTYTKQHAAQNRAMIQRAKELLKGANLNETFIARHHPDVKEAMKKEFPDVKPYRIDARMTQAIRQLRNPKARLHRLRA